MKIERLRTPKMIIHSMWISVPNGYDEVFHQYHDYLVDEPDWWNDEDVEDWKKEIRDYIEEEMSGVSVLSWTKWEDVRIWYDFSNKEIDI